MDAASCGMNADAWDDFVHAYCIGSDVRSASGCRAQDSPVALSDLKAASQADGASLLYGELLPHGLYQALQYLGVESLTGGCLLELGSGSGKLAVQSCLSFGLTGSLCSIIGMELAPSRHSEGVHALRRLAQRRPECYGEVCERARSTKLTLQPSSASKETFVELRCGDFLRDLPGAVIAGADVLLLQVCIPPGLYKRLFNMLASLKPGARILSLLDLICTWQTLSGHKKKCPVRSLETGFLCLPSSWAPCGHRFFVLEAVSTSHVEADIDFDVESSAAPLTECVLCEGVQDGSSIPTGLLPPSGVCRSDIHRGMAIEVASAYCLRTPGAGARLFEEEEVCEVDPDTVDWLPAWVVASTSSTPPCDDVVDVLHEDGTIEAFVSLERVRRPQCDATNQFGGHQDGIMRDTE